MKLDSSLVFRYMSSCDLCVIYRVGWKYENVSYFMWH